MNLFGSLLQNKLDSYFDLQLAQNPKYSPSTLIKILRKSSQMKYFKKKINTKTKNVFKVFKRLTLCSLLVIYSSSFYEFISEIPMISTGDKWIDSEFIHPYILFLRKIGHSQQMYEFTKRQTAVSLKGECVTNMELLFYNIGLFKQIFRIVNKMPLLGRYYKDKNSDICQQFISTIAVHAQKIYFSFRSILTHMVENALTQIPDKNAQTLMRTILRDQLPEINEQMKKLFLDKYFYPLGKGIGIKLFKPQEQSATSEKTIMGIISNHQDTNREQSKKDLETTLFPEPGKVNIMFYEQTLMSKMLISSDDAQNEKYEEIVADVQNDDQSQENESHDSKDIDKNQLSISIALNGVGGKNQKTENQIQTGIQRHYGQFVADV